MLSEKIRNLRKQNNLTQEELAEKLSVSRQAITKWETGNGIPDIGNLETLAKAFGITIDELLSEGEAGSRENVSRSEFDIFGKTDFDITFGSARSLDVTLGETEKAVVEISTDLEDRAYRLAKVKLDNGRKIDIAVLQIKLDKNYVSVATDKALSRQDAMEHVDIRIILPAALSDKIELDGETGRLFIHDFSEPKHLEFDGKAGTADIRNVKGHFEVSLSNDANINYDGSLEQLDINQLNCVSGLFLTKGAKVNVYSKARSCNVIFDNYENLPEAESRVELNGRKTELTVRGE
ncbi:MAG: helix-turn-helix transcriptional regulator [Lachnospiraceae bacterium]|nr:helix-turn-helix transcriptional regulator [Lachnospiraceae bacterium]